VWLQQEGVCEGNSEAILAAAEAGLTTSRVGV
jgi:hypothetical protein